MIQENYGGQIKEVPLICPECKNKNKIKIPDKVINQSKQLTTISIPSGLVCEHTFQAFIDKNFKVRGYQRVDYELSKVEILSGGAEPSKEESDLTDHSNTLSSLPKFREIINLLRSAIDDKDILGSGLFTIEGNILYSSLPQGVLVNAIREFEIRDKKKLVGVKKMLLELENQQKVCSEYLDFYNTKTILVLFFSSHIKLGMGIMLLNQMARDIMKMI